MTTRTDVVVIGGGCTGTGVARDLALRGMGVILLEQVDLAYGATGRFHGLLHSGGRYVVSDPTSARECREENAILRRVAAACIEDTGGFFVATEDDDPAYEARFLAGCRTAGIPVEEISPSEARREEPYLTPRLRRVFRVPDAAIDGFDLVRANARGTVEGGGEVWTHHRAIAIHVRDDAVCGVRARDMLTGEEREIACDWVVNAAGGWAEGVAALAGVPLKLVLSKGTMIVANHRWCNHVLNRCRYPTDGDILVPAKQVCIVGTTALTVPQPEALGIEPHEVDEMVAAGNDLVPGFRGARLLRAYAGVRPLYQDAGDQSVDTRDVTRGYVVLDHEARDGVARLISVVGGKLTTYRRMAEEAVDLLCRKAGIRQPCRTANVPLPGSELWLDAKEVAAKYGLPLYTTQRLLQRHGPNAERILADTLAAPHLKSHICICEPVIEAEIRYVIRYQWVRTLNDLRKRTRLGTGPCQGTGCTLKAAAILADELGCDINQVRQQVADFLQERWAGRQPVLEGVQLAQEELVRAAYRCAGEFTAKGGRDA